LLDSATPPQMLIELLPYTNT